MRLWTKKCNWSSSYIGTFVPSWITKIFSYQLDRLVGNWWVRSRIFQTMSLRRFFFLLHATHFDNIRIRWLRQTQDKLAPTGEIFETLLLIARTIILLVSLLLSMKILELFWGQVPICSVPVIGWNILSQRALSRNQTLQLILSNGLSNLYQVVDYIDHYCYGPIPLAEEVITGWHFWTLSWRTKEKYLQFS